MTIFFNTIAAALAGIGICQLPSFMMQAYLTEGRLEKVLGEYGVGSLPIHALYLQ